MSAADVVVTGLGVVAPLGRTLDSFWSNALGGTRKLAELTRFDTGSLRCKVGAEVPLSDTDRHSEQTLVSTWALEAAIQATDEAALFGSGAPTDRTGVCFGTVMGTRPALEGPIERAGDHDYAARAWVRPALIARFVASRLGVHGPTCTMATACAGGNSAIAYGAEAIRSGRADAMIVGGADEISLGSLLVFDSFRALTKDYVRPFDRNRRGLALGEGAAALVLERLDAAEERGASIHGTVLGWANVCDAHHITAPNPQGRGALRGMRNALAEGGLTAGDIDHISAHGTGTVANDRAEAGAIQSLLGPGEAEGIPVTALKSMMGHAQGAASAIEAVACLLTIRDDVIPPTVGYETVDPDCCLDVVHGGPREVKVRVALNNAFGFGGNIECVVFGA